MVNWTAGLLVSMFLLLPSSAHADGNKKKVIKYRKHTTLDFSETAVQGKVRSPDVFYIFQRRRSEGPQLVDSPEELDSLRDETRSVVEGLL